ncbi:MAG: hypothetical protein ACLP5H_20395, partial [Desulfomonilaceae bacterium]
MGQVFFSLSIDSVIMYPYFEIANGPDAMAGMKKACYNIVQEPREYRWRIEAFVADPGGYAWNLITLK